MSTKNISSLFNYYHLGETRSYSFRKKELKKLYKSIQHYEPKILDALSKDLHKSAEEAYATEVGVVLAELSHCIKHLKEWMLPKPVSTPMVLLPSSSKILYDPLGVCLIIAPWNYPFQLLLAPLIGAIAGGNCVVLKPSEFTPHTSLIVKELVETTFDKNYITVVEGDGKTVVSQLMNEYRFDHVFFTGSISVGKEIALLAAHQLIPTTLELGGKSPCIIDKDIHLKSTVQRITWGKFTNAGQTCVAPDYLMIHESMKEKVIDGIKKCIQDFYGENPNEANDYARIINENRFNKLSSYLSEGNIILGGKTNKETLYFSPTLMENIHNHASLLQDEIFGPILPIFTFSKIEEVIEKIQEHPNPLALYVFSNNQSVQNKLVENISFGGGCINNTLVHLGNPNLPFGGVAYSGMGMYHGEYSFKTFTRPKAIMKSNVLIDPSIKYPPYTNKLKLLKLLLK